MATLKTQRNLAMKKYMMALFLLYCMQERLYADYFGPVEYTIFALLIIGIVHESDNFYEKKAPKNSTISTTEQLLNFQLHHNALPEIKVLPVLGLQLKTSLNMKFEENEKPEIAPASIMLKKMYVRPPLKQLGSFGNNWIPLKSRKFC